MKGIAAVIEPVLAACGIDGHPADGIAHGCLGVNVMLMVSVTGVIVASAAAAGSLCSPAYVCVSGLRHRILHRTCNLYLVGVYRGHEKRHQDVLSKTPEPHRGPGSRPIKNGR